MMTPSGYIYFIRPVGSVGPIKIGYSTRTAVRLRELTNWSPVPLEVIVTIPGAYQLETRLHQCFAFAHLHFEWFAPVDPLLRGIDALRNGAAVEEAFDLSAVTGKIKNIKPRDRSYLTPQYRERRSYAFRIDHAQRRHDALAPREAEKILCSSRAQIPLTEDEKAWLDRLLADPAKHFTPFTRAEKLRA
jgi:hypothetical protein